MADPFTLDGLSAILHDARIYPNCWQYSKNTGTFTLTVWEADTNAVLYQNIFACLYWKTVPWRRCCLEFLEVQNVVVKLEEERPKVPYFELASLRYLESRGVIQIVTHYLIYFELTVTAISGTFTRTEETSWQDALRSLTLGAEKTFR
jgi:hypothetical protein